MADQAEKQAVEAAEAAGFETASSEEQAEANEHNARTPQSAAPQSSAGLTGHTTERSVAVDEDTGKTQAFHQTTVVTDPESPLAVQVPDPDVHPGANATTADPLGVHGEPTPEEYFAEHASEQQEADEDNPAVPAE